MKTVLIVTGRGKDPENEPVLRSKLERYFADEGKIWVPSGDRLPGSMGGGRRTGGLSQNRRQTPRTPMNVM